MPEMQGVFDPETLAILRAAFDDACGSLPSGRDTANMRSTLAKRILKLAAQGERDPIRLRAYALMEAVSSNDGEQSGRLEVECRVAFPGK